MQNHTRCTTLEFDSIVAVSPGYEGDDEKNQDRAKYYPRIQVAAVCDGISSSPYSEAAANIGVIAAPGLFDGDHKERLACLSQALFAQRWASQHDPVSIPADFTPEMVPAVREAFRCQMERAFQTTIVTVRLVSIPGGIRSQVICCGDSALFAFRPDGAPLISTRRWECGANGHGDKASSSPNSRASFGTEILVNIVGPLPRWPGIAKRCDIPPQYQKSWYVCIPIDVSAGTGGEVPVNEPSRLVQCSAAAPWLVPAFLLGQSPSIGASRYRVIPYSRSIRHIPSQPRADNVDTSITPALPDHFASGRWVYTEETLPSDTHFVLASDGFYRAFDDEAEIWAWLVHNQAGLNVSADSLNEVHNRLKRGPGDDDVSLVWVRPAGFPVRFGGRVVATRTAGGDNHGR